MTTYLHGFGTRSTPQSEPIPDSTQVPNSAGGYAWAVDDWGRLARFLILGSEGGTYYIGERDLTRENVDTLRRILKEDGLRFVREVVAVSEDGRAPKNTPAIFALALAASEGDEDTKAAALAALPRVCRIGTHLFEFVSFAQEFRGWGRGLRRAVSRWYAQPVDKLAYQAIKYRQRGGWTHRDLLRLAHPKPTTTEHRRLFGWIAEKVENPELPAVTAFLRAQASESPKETAALIAEVGNALPREAIKSEHLATVEVWEALLDANMPMTAMLRNLATMTRIGLLKPLSAGTGKVVEQLGDAERIRKARVHPIAVLAAMTTYASGQSVRGSGEWEPVAQIVDALDGTFYSAFGNVEPTGKRTMLALDVSGSMSFEHIAGIPGLTPRIGSAAMALVTAATEPNHFFTAFSHEMVPLTISPRSRLDDAVRVVSSLPYGGTDCSLPMLYALQQGIDVDTFVVYTDSETWAGHVHPAQALRAYRDKTGIGAKLVVVGMTSNGFTVADPNDAGMLDVVGFDSATPNVLAAFSAA